MGPWPVCIVSGEWAQGEGAFARKPRSLAYYTSNSARTVPSSTSASRRKASFWQIARISRFSARDRRDHSLQFFVARHGDQPAVQFRAQSLALTAIVDQRGPSEAARAVGGADHGDAVRREDGIQRMRFRTPDLMGGILRRVLALVAWLASLTWLDLTGAHSPVSVSLAGG